MRWTKKFLAEVAERLQQLGVKACPVCGSDALVVGRLPVYVLGGGLPGAAGGRPRDVDPDRRTDYAVRVECSLCGHIMVFNSERYRTSDTKNLVMGLTDQEEDDLEGQ